MSQIDLPADFSEGVILLDKPSGITSHDAVAMVRRSLPGRAKVGHSGTLDPFATGLLLMLVGAATRTQSLFMGLDKEYRATATFGATSTTGDPEGQIKLTGEPPPVQMKLPTGTFLQRPPAWSAIHVDGERAHRRARRGEDVVIPEREVTVDEFRQITDHGAERDYLIRCSSGTYVRSLIADLGDAYCSSLRRTAIGPFSVEQAGETLSLADALGRIIPVVEVDASDANDLCHGRPIGGECTDVTAFTHDGRVIALARTVEPGRSSPFTVLSR